MLRWVCYCEECQDFEVVKEELYFDDWDLKPLFCPFCSGQIDIYENEEDDDEID